MKQFVILLYLWLVNPQQPAQYTISRLWVNGQEHHFSKCLLVDTRSYFAFTVDSQREVFYYEKIMDDTRMGCRDDYPFVVKINYEGQLANGKHSGDILFTYQGITVKFLIENMKEYEQSGYGY